MSQIRKPEPKFLRQPDQFKHHPSDSRAKFYPLVVFHAVDLAWIVETTNTREYYLLARVVKINDGSDAIARSAEFRRMS